MNPKIQKLMRLLLEKQPQTAAALSSQMDVSVRTIKNYVHELNGLEANTITSGNDGYHIDPQKALTLLKENEEDQSFTAENRIFYLITNIIRLEDENDALDMYDLCDELYISMSTLKNDLVRVKRKLKRYDLTLDTKGEMIHCIGLEKNKRKLLSTTLYDESNVNFVNLDSMQKTFKNIDIAFIRETILSTFDRYHYFINDYSLINLLLHITISIDRIQNGNANTQDIQDLPGVRLHEFQIAAEMARQFEKKFDIAFSDAEIYEMTLLIVSRATSIDYKSINVDNIADFIGEDCLNLVNLLIDEIKESYYVDLSEPEFFIRFALHIKNLLVRSQNNYFSKNPLAESIKTSCPLIYDVSVHLASIIKQETGIAISDDEIAYIAFHIGSALETQKNLTEKVKGALYCPNYYDLNIRITDSIQTSFNEDLLIRDIFTDESQLNALEGDVDLLIATIPVAKALAIPVVNINIFLNDRDKMNLQTQIRTIQKERQKSQFETHLRTLVTPDLFETKKAFASQGQCIDYMVKKLVKLGYVDPDFKKDILERERISSTAFGDFALPHAMKMKAHKTGIFILISPTAIPWGNHSVHLIMMMCFNANERHVFNELYDPITMILSEPENVKTILKTKDYEEFIQLFVSLL